MDYKDMPLGRLMEAISKMKADPSKSELMIGICFEQVGKLVKHLTWVLRVLPDGSIKVEPVEKMPYEVPVSITFAVPYGLRLWKELWLFGGKNLIKAMTHDRVKIALAEEYPQVEMIAMFVKDDKEQFPFGEEVLVDAFREIGLSVTNFDL